MTNEAVHLLRASLAVAALCTLGLIVLRIAY
jgi:hypothetical protein